MRKVDLLTCNHEFVATVALPAFVIMPEVLVWGARTFLYVGARDCYVEAWCFWVPEVPYGP